MGRIRVFSIFALLIGAVLSQAADYRLVIASDDPEIRKAAAMVVFEGSGKLKPEDRITSITFSSDAIEPNCLVSLDPSSGKSDLAMSPDVEIFKGKVMIAGIKPTKKVIPAHIAIDVPIATGVKDGKLSGVMQPIIKQVNNLPWFYIIIGVGIFMGFTFFLNRRSQQFTTSMSKEAKNLYLETVGRITERLERIETTQERLVKNPPVVRTFKAQIEDFEGRLGRIEKLAKETKDEVGRASAELGQSEKRHEDIVGRIDSTKTESTKTQTTLKQEADALRAELKLILKGQDEATSKLNALEDLKANDNQILNHSKQIEAALAAQESQILSAQAEHLQHLQQMQAELATMRANQEALSAMPKELELVSASLANFPAEFESVRSSMPRLDGIEKKLDSFSDFGPKLDHISTFGDKLDYVSSFDTKFDRFDEISDKLNALTEIEEKLNVLPELQNKVNELPTEFPSNEEELNRVHESLLLEIESLSGKIDDSDAHLSELISAHKFEAPQPVAEQEAELTPEPVETKKSKRGKHIQPAAEVSEEPTSDALDVEPENEFTPELEATEAALLDSPEPEAVTELEPENQVEEVTIEQIEAATEPELEPEAVLEISEEAALEPEAELEVIAETELEPEAIIEPELETAELASSEESQFETETAVEPEPEAFIAEETSEPIAETIEEQDFSAETPDVFEQEFFEAPVEFSVGSDEPTAEVEMFKQEISEDEVLGSIEPEVFGPEMDSEDLSQVQMDQEEAFQEDASGVIEPKMALETESKISEESEPSAEPIQEDHHEFELKAIEVQYRYAEPETPSIPEFNFSNVIKKMTEETTSLPIKDDTHRAGQEAPITFKLEELPTHLETFEDAGEDTVLQTFHSENQEQFFEDNGNEAAELVLRDLEKAKSSDEVVADFDAEPEEEGDAQVGQWSGAGASGSRTWGSESSRPLELVKFEGELKPLTPIETAPIGDTIGSMVYGQGRVIYSCGKNVIAFWPGKDDRHATLDFPVATDDWRMTLKGQSLFVVEDKKVKILSTQGWFVLEQFSGEYHDQLLIGSRWAGLRNENGPVIDFRDLRGQMLAAGVRLDMDWDGLQLTSSDQRLIAASRDGRFFEVSEFGTELLGAAPEGGQLLHASAYEDGLIALLQCGDSVQCFKLNGEGKSLNLDLKSFAGKPIQLGNKLYLADLEHSRIISINLKKMTSSQVSSLEGVSGIRRVIGVQHKSQHNLFVITVDEGKKSGRLVMIDAKTGQETTFGSVGQANVNLIAADHHVVLSTSSQYQNVIRVLEPFAQRVAA